MSKHKENALSLCSMNISDFMFCLLKGIKEPEKICRQRLKSKIEDGLTVQAIDLAFNTKVSNKFQARELAFRMNKISPFSLKSNLLEQDIKKACNELLTGKMPAVINDLDITGDDLLRINLRDKQIGIAQREVLQAVFKDEIKNNKTIILKWLLKR